jgi:hypothetical protein
VAQRATLSQDGVLQSLSFYVRMTGGQLRLGVYDATVRQAVLAGSLRKCHHHLTLTVAHDIHDHPPTIFREAVAAWPRLMVELGTRAGISTRTSPARAPQT